MTRVEIMEIARRHELILEKLRAGEIKRHSKFRYLGYDDGVPIKSFEVLHEYAKCTGKLK